MSKPRWIDHLDQVVGDECIGVAGLSCTFAQAVLQQRQWTGETDELDEGTVADRRNMCPDDHGPAPGEKDATHDEADEQQMDDHHEVSASPVPHQVTLPRGHTQATIDPTPCGSRSRFVHYSRDGGRLVRPY